MNAIQLEQELGARAVESASARAKYDGMATTYFELVLKALDEIRDVAMGDCLRPEDYGRVALRCEEIAQAALATVADAAEVALVPEPNA